jgi:alkylation response protein AidB-like acyl-CoA dehydrogenase
VVNFALSDDQELLRQTVRQFLEQRSPEAQIRRLMDLSTGFDEAMWTQMAEQLGLQGLAIPEEFGGSGYSFRELGIVLEEMGRALVVAPFFSTTVLATGALFGCGDDAAKKEFLPLLASGEAVGTLAVTEVDGSWAEASIGLQAAKTTDGYLLTGTKPCVLDGFDADLILVAARASAGVSLFAVRGDVTGLSRAPLSTMDQTRRLARLDFDATPAQLVGEEGGGWPAVEHALLWAAAGLASEQIGGAQRCLELSVDYAKQRIQFGRVIGSFQSVKHKCADMLVQLELAKSAALYAAMCVADDDPDLPVAAAMAKSYCSEAFFTIAAETIQVHGGIGFTWEHPAHLYYKRAKASELLFGHPRHHRKLLFQHLGIT